MSNDRQQVPPGLLRWHIVAALLAPVAAMGQVRPVQSGQALDANPRIGSAGRNTRISAEPGFDSQLYVTGQVSGLRRFHGTVGYFGDNELHLALPSAALGDFRRKSVGLSDVLGGLTYEPTPYYERTTTMVNAGGILRGMAAPGTSVPTTAIPAATPLGQRLYVDALAEFYSVEALTPGRALAPPTPMSLFPSLAPGVVAGAAAGAAAAPVPEARSPEGMPIFAVPGSTERASLARELYREARRTEIVDRRIEGRIEAAADGTPRHAEAAPGGERTPDTAVAAGRDETRGGPLGTRLGEPVPDQDVFMDLMMLGLHQRQLKRTPTTAPATTATTATAPAPAAAPLPARTGSLVNLDTDGQIVIHGLAGQSEDLFNTRMAEATETLRQKRYYDAVGLYETAGRITPRNPLARVGMGLSLLGAGESLSAARQFSRALSLFPPMTESRIDLTAMIDAKVIEAELATIDGRVGRADDETARMLEFLAMFLYYNSRQDAKAKSFAEKVQASSHNAALLRAYAELILRGRQAEGGGAPKPDDRAPAKDPANGRSP